MFQNQDDLLYYTVIPHGCHVHREQGTAVFTKHHVTARATHAQASHLSILASLEYVTEILHQVAGFAMNCA